MGNGAAPDAVFRVASKRSFWFGRGLAALAFALVCANVLRTGVGIAGVIGVMGVMGALGLGMFGFFALYALRQALRRGPRLTLSREGFDAADLGVGVIAWNELDTVETFGSREAPFVAFRVRDPEPYLARMSPWRRVFTRLLRAQGLPPFSINLIGVDRDLAEIEHRARAMIDLWEPP